MTGSTTTQPSVSVYCEHGSAAHGLWFADGQHRCSRCWSDDDRALLQATDRLALNIGLKRVSPCWIGCQFAWPYGPNIDVRARLNMIAWATENGLRLSERGRCIRWLRQGQCGLRWSHNANCGIGASWYDHVTGWNRGKPGRPAVLVAQPYSISAEDREELSALDAEDGLRVEIKDQGWYGHGAKFIAIWCEAA